MNIINSYCISDDDECTLGTDNCDTNAMCTNTPAGSFTCTCNAGYSGDGTSCTGKKPSFSCVFLFKHSDLFNFMKLEGTSIHFTQRMPLFVINIILLNLDHIYLGEKSYEGNFLQTNMLL